MENQLSVVVVGAHPDDCEEMTAGTVVRYREMGHRVTYITTTTGDAGHHRLSRPEIKARRREETRAVATYLDINYEVMDIPDGTLEPNLENRHSLIRLLRKYGPDLIITHSLYDYHPDHRYTTQLILDTAYMLNVPLCVPDIPAVHKDVVYCHMSTSPKKDDTATVLVPVDNYMEQKVYALHQNTSQIYEWLPWIDGYGDERVPDEESERLDYLRRHWYPSWKRITENYHSNISTHSSYNQDRHIEFIEAYAASYVGTPLTRENARRYFPFSDAIIY